MDDAFPKVLPEDSTLLQQMVREQWATVVALLHQRDAARQGQAQMQERHGELEHQHEELEHQHEELQRRYQQSKAEQDQKIAELQKECDQKIAELELEKLRVIHQLNLLKKRYYGPRADRVNLSQLLLEFAQELEVRPVNPQDLPAGQEPVDGKTVRRVKHGRRRLADLDLPTVENIHDLSEQEKTCASGHALVKIGQEVTWQIERAPGFFYRVKQVQIKYGCAECEENGDNPQITLAEKPLQPIDKGMAGPGCWPTWSPASSLTTCRCTGWRTSSPAADSPSTVPPCVCGRAMWPTWSSRCTTAWCSGFCNRM